MHRPHLPAGISRLASLLALGAAALLLGVGPRTPAAENPSPNDPRLDWFRKARFGLFIHWGPVAVRGTEIGWSRGDQVPIADYDSLYRQFNPTNFEARAWTRLARDAGMRYVVLTSKHHDGFALWPSDLTEYDIAATPFQRDVVRELADAARRDRLVFALYHSICDWRHPDYPLGSPGGRVAKPAPNMARYVAYLHGQLDELLTRYGPLGILWFDGEWEAPWTEPLGQELYDFVRARQPRILVNNRVGKGRHDMEGTTAKGAFAGDYDTPEQQVGRFENQRPWESCITICQQWAWKPNDQLKSLDECVRTLVTCAGGDGNLLLNVGPMPDGRIEPRQADRLREIGGWLQRNGEAIYDTRGGPYHPGKWGAATHRGRHLFLHLFPNAEGTIVLPPLPAKVLSAKTMAGTRISAEATATALKITVPAAARDPVVTVVDLRLDQPVAGLTPIP